MTWSPDVLLASLSALLIVAGALFFTAGTIGLIRFPDVRSQLHALTKADNLGVGLVFAGVALHAASWSTALLLGLAWLLLLGTASVSAHALAGAAVRREGAPPPGRDTDLPRGRGPDPDGPS